MECEVCHYKTDKFWLLKRHKTRSKKCNNLKKEFSLFNQIEMFKIQEQKYLKQIRSLRIENYELKKNEGILCDFILFHKDEINKDIIKNLYNIEEFNEAIEYIIKILYYDGQQEYLICGFKPNESENCQILINNEWKGISFEEIVEELWQDLFKPIFKEIKKEWCTFGHNRRLNQILYKLFYSHAVQPPSS